MPAPVAEHATPPPISPELSVDGFAWRGLRSFVLDAALARYREAWAAGLTTSPLYVIVDYATPSEEPRLWVLDLAAGRMLFQVRVAHGSGSGFRMPGRFSDREGSHQSSVGLARTAEPYQSEKFQGQALRLDGLEPGVNGHMRDRAIVLHPATYATAATVELNRDKEGVPRLGRSQGCLAVDPAVSDELIATIADGVLIYSYHPWYVDEKLPARHAPPGGRQP